MKNLPSAMFGVLVVLVVFAFVTSCSSPAEIERARAETVRQEVRLEEAKAATTIASADAFVEKSQASIPYALIVIFVGASVLVFFVWYLRRAEESQEKYEQRTERKVQISAPEQQQAQLPPIVINLMLAGSGDTRPTMTTYRSDFKYGNQPYLIEAQPVTREVARLVD